MNLNVHVDQPGWLAIQRVVEDHVEVYFLPPERMTSLKGSLALFTDVRIAPGAAWDQARQDAWESAARETLPIPVKE